MFSVFAGVLRAAAFVTVLIGPAASAHEGHDHGEKPAATVTPTLPRVAVQSDQYELVGILKGPRLDIYLDRFSTNEPVPDARITVTTNGDEQTEADPTPNGTYTVASGKFAGSGPLEFIFDIRAKTGDDLLIGTLNLPARVMAPVAGTTSPAASWTAGLREAKARIIAWATASPPLSLTAPVVIVFTFTLGLCVGLLLRWGRRLASIAALAAVGLLAIAGVALAHEGEDHGNEAKMVMPAADILQRLPDGTAFVPKPTQRLLEIRTTIANPEKAEKAVNLIGRVIADPNRGGIVQSLIGGRLIAPEKGLPRMGQAVKRGDVLALIEPAVPQADRTTISERAGEIEQLIAVAEAKLNRIRPLAERGIVAQSQLVDAQTELAGLRRRREIVHQTRVESEVLRAPIDGVISVAKAIAGQVVQTQDVLFQIVDPKSLWVEALVFNGLNPATIRDASAVASDGTTLKLVFQGFSRALQQQASVIQFAILDPPPSISIGQPVTVIASNGALVEGIILPRDAVVRGGNGEAQVWHHTDPERFESQLVRTEPFDATRVIVRAGVTPGERIVVRGAELINQVR
jgi:membrane fusion protein, heavy metal efflux system